MCCSTIETLPLMWMELTVSQPLKMALGHTKFGMCQLSLLSGCFLSEVRICKRRH